MKYNVNKTGILLYSFVMQAYENIKTNCKNP